MSAAGEPRFTRFSLGRVLDDLGMTLLEVAHGRIDETENIGGVSIYDPVDEPIYPEHAIVLGVGVHGPEQIVGMLNALGPETPAAVVVRSPVELTEEVRRASDEHGTTLLGLARGATWTQVAALLRSLLAEDDIGEARVDSFGGIPSGDLFAVANAISSLISAPVTIEDRSSRVLAFSEGQLHVDPGRVETIIGRRVPARITQVLTERGVFRDLYRSEDPLEVGAIEFEDGHATERVAIGVRAGDEVLGTIWAAMDGPLTPELTTTLRDAAKLVALHLLRVRAGAGVQRRLRAELLSTALEGGAGASDALSRLNLMGKPVCVVAAVLTEAPEESTDVAGQTVMAERERFADAFTVHLSALRPGSAVALLSDTVFGIIPAPNDPGCERVVQTMEDFLDRLGGHTSASIAVGPLAHDLLDVARSRATAQRVLRALQERTPSANAVNIAPRVARLSDVHALVLTLELKELMTARGDEITGPISALIEHDRKHRGHLVETLQAWFDYFGDVRQAATALFVHPNTFRYRLRRATEIASIDLGDADERFAAMLQLRLIARKNG
ncbi:PucR family transcriptional regulator [Agromyces italicus]|uniref:PucR family transcriptional regulator n=1 Tax=Agromyces italicus TaxID=279572 RepID=UPI0006878C6E|nr:helix-turn-helix domain-containing protein [Agromyces italicus]